MTISTEWTSASAFSDHKFIMPREPMGPRVVVPKPSPTPYQIVVEPLQTHDGTPCITAWSRHERQPTRPVGSIQVYSTTSPSPSDISALAHKLQADVFGPGGPKNLSNYNDRLDIYGLAIPDKVSEAEIVKRCVAHQRAEIESRDKDEGKRGMYRGGIIQGTTDDLL